MKIMKKPLEKFQGELKALGVEVFDKDNISNKDKNTILELIKEPKNKKLRKSLKKCLDNNKELLKEFNLALVDYYTKTEGKIEDARKYFEKLKKQHLLLEEQYLALEEQELVPEKQYLELEKNIKKNELLIKKSSEEHVFPIMDKNGNYKKLDEIKELKGETLVIYYDKTLEQMVVQPMEDFEKKEKTEKEEIIKEINNIHVEGHRFGNSEYTRNRLGDFLTKGDKKTFTILPAIKTNIAQPKETAEKEGKKIAKFMEDILNLYKDSVDKEYDGKIVLSGNSISNYTMLEITNYLREKKCADNAKVDLIINQPAIGGFGPVQINELDLNINKELLEWLNTIMISNGKFDQGEKFTDFHKRNIYIKLLKKICEILNSEFNEDEIGKNGAIVILKLNGKTFKKILSFEANEGYTYKNALKNSVLEKQKISPDLISEELKSELNLKKESDVEISKKSGTCCVDFFGIDKTGKEVTVAYSLIENKITKKVCKDKYKTKIKENEKEVELDRDITIINNNFENNIHINIYHDGKFDYLDLKKEKDKIIVKVNPPLNNSEGAFELQINENREIKLEDEQEKEIKRFIEVDFLKNLLVKKNSVKLLEEENNELFDTFADLNGVLNMLSPVKQQEEEDCICI